MAERRMERYTLTNEQGIETYVLVTHQHQHIWSVTMLPVSPRVAARVRKSLGDGVLRLATGYGARVELGHCSQCGLNLVENVRKLELPPEVTPDANR